MADVRSDASEWRRRLRDVQARLQDAQSSDELRRHAEDVSRQSRQRWDRMQEVHAAMRALTATAVSPRREVSVTAVWGGAVSEVKFPTAAYKRLPMAELSAILQTTIAEAQRKVNDAAADLMAPALPSGLDARALMNGDLDLRTIMPTAVGDDAGPEGDSRAANERRGV